MKPDHSTACVLYARVSTDSQTVANQVEVLRRMAGAQGHADPMVITETESGARRRPALEALVDRARRGEVKVIFVWALDRLGRGGALEALRLLQELSAVGCGVVSHQEPWLQTTEENPFRDVLVAFAATVARMERSRLIERTKAGLARARAQGKRLGRPPASIVLLRAAAELVGAGVPVAEAARSKGVHRNSLRRYLAQNPIPPVASDRAA